MRDGGVVLGNKREKKRGRETDVRRGKGWEGGELIYAKDSDSQDRQSNTTQFSMLSKRQMLTNFVKGLSNFSDLPRPSLQL